MLKLTSREPVREPGFSKSECLELARRIDRGFLVVATRYYLHDGNQAEEVSAPQRDTIVAALRAYAK